MNCPACACLRFKGVVTYRNMDDETTLVQIRCANCDYMFDFHCNKHRPSEKPEWEQTKNLYSVWNAIDEGREVQVKISGEWVPVKEFGGELVCEGHTVKVTRNRIFRVKL